MNAKARLGVLLPASDITVEEELPALLDDVATCHFARMPLTGVTPAALRAMADQAVASAELLAAAHPHIVLYACTSGTFVLGAEHERLLVARLEQTLSCPVVTTAQSVIAALRRHGPRVRLRAPYLPELTQAESAYFQSFGLTVTSTDSLGLEVDSEIAATTTERLLSFVHGEDEADSLMLSCTNLRTRGAREALERSAGLPMVTSNSASAAAVRERLAARRHG